MQHDWVLLGFARSSLKVMEPSKLHAQTNVAALIRAIQAVSSFGVVPGSGDSRSGQLLPNHLPTMGQPNYCCCSLSKCIYSDAEEAEQESGASEIGHGRPVHICIGTCQSLM